MQILNFSYLKPQKLEALLGAFEQYQELVIIAESTGHSVNIKETGIGVLLEIDDSLSHLHFFDLISWFHYKNLPCTGWCTIDGMEYFLQIDHQNKLQDTLIGVAKNGQRISCYLPDASIAYLDGKAFNIKPESPKNQPFKLIHSTEVYFDNLEQLEHL